MKNQKIVFLPLFLILICIQNVYAYTWVIDKVEEIIPRPSWFSRIFFQSPASIVYLDIKGDPIDDDICKVESSYEPGKGMVSLIKIDYDKILEQIKKNPTEQQKISVTPWPYKCEIIESAFNKIFEAYSASRVNIPKNVPFSPLQKNQETDLKTEDSAKRIEITAEMKASDAALQKKVYALKRMVEEAYWPGYPDGIFFITALLKDLQQAVDQDNITVRNGYFIIQEDGTLKEKLPSKPTEKWYWADALDQEGYLLFKSPIKLYFEKEVGRFYNKLKLEHGIYASNLAGSIDRLRTFSIKSLRMLYKFPFKHLLIYVQGIKKQSQAIYNQFQKSFVVERDVDKTIATSSGNYMPFFVPQSDDPHAMKIHPRSIVEPMSYGVFDSQMYTRLRALWIEKATPYVKRIEKLFDAATELEKEIQVLDEK